MKTWAQVLKDAHVMIGAQLAALEKGERAPYCYIYGGDGTIMTEKKIRALVKKYGKVHFDEMFKRTGKTVDDLVAHCVDKYGLDCSEFVCRVTGAPHDMNSAALIAACDLVTYPAAGVAGSVVWKNGHVGLDLGAGIVAEFCEEFTDIKMGLLKDRGFVKSGQLPWVDYRGASNM